MKLEATGLEQIDENVAVSSSLELPVVSPDTTVSPDRFQSNPLSPFRYNKIAFLITISALAVIVLIGVAGLLLTGFHAKQQPIQSNAQKIAKYAITNLPLTDAKISKKLQLGEADHLAVNGQLQVSNTIVLTPGTIPTARAAGQIYYDQSANAPYYYNGTQFISLAPTAMPQHVTSIGGMSGVIGVGSGLQLAGGELALTSAVTQFLNGNYRSNNSIVGAGSINQIALFSGNQILGDSILSQNGSGLNAAGSLTVTAAIFSNTLQQIAAGNNVNISAGTDSLIFTAGGRTFQFPTSGSNAQVICTTGVPCGSDGQAVTLQPGSSQLDTGSGSSIFINNTGGGNLLQLQSAGSDRFVVTNAGNTTIGGTLSVAGGSLTVDGSGNITTTGTITGSGNPTITGFGAISGQTLQLSNSSTSSSAIQKNALIGTGGVTQYDVVVYANDSGTDHVMDTTAARDPKVYGVASATAASGASSSISISGNFIVNADTAAVSIGDQMVTSTTSGRATADNNATTGIIGYATTTKAGGSNGTVGLMIRPINGQSTPIFSPQSNSVTAFQVQNATRSTTVLDADTTNTRIGIGNNTPLYTLDVSGTVNTSTQYDVAGVQIASSNLSDSANLAKLNGTQIFTGYNTFKPSVDSTTAFQVQQQSSGNTILGVNSTSGTVGVGGAGNGTDKLSITSSSLNALTANETGSNNILQLQNNGTNVVTVSNTGATTLQNSTNSTTAFQIQNGAGTSNLLIADTANSRIGIGKAPAQGALDVNGSIYASGAANVDGITSSGGYAYTASAGGFQFTSTTISGGYISKGANAPGGVTANDVVVISGVSAGTTIVSDTTTARDTRVYGVAQTTSSSSDNIIISGNFIVNATATTNAINIGDQLVTSASSGRVMADNSATTGILGTALSALASGTGTVSVAIRPINGQSTPIFSPQSNSVTAFQVQNATRSTTVLDADTTNTRIGIGNNTPLYTLDVSGTVNTSTQYDVAGVQIASSNLSDSANLAKLNGTQIFTGYNTFKPSVDSTTAFQVQNASSVAALSVDTTNLTVTTQAGTDVATSTELFTSSESFPATTGWGSISGTGASATATHVTGTSALSPTPALSVVNGKQYQVTYTVTTPNAGTTLAVTMGGVTIASYSFDANNAGTFTDSNLITASATTNLAFTPSTGFTGTVSSVSVELITQNTHPALVVNNASGVDNLEVRASSQASNLFIGTNAGESNTTGSYNTVLGWSALQNNTTGSQNTAFGVLALSNNTTGSFNAVFGNNALLDNTSGVYNTAIGITALQHNTTGSNNIALGNYSLGSNISGSNNIGISGLTNNTTGSLNVGIGGLFSDNGNANTSVGIFSMYNSTSANNDTALGYQALQSDSTGSYNLALGMGADVLSDSLGSLHDSTAIGHSAQVGFSNNIILGYSAANSENNTVGIGTSFAPNELTVSPLTYGTNGTSCSGVTITQAGTSITANSACFTPGMTGGTVYAMGSGGTAIVETVTYASATTLTASAPHTVTAGSAFNIVWGGFNVTNTGTTLVQPTTNSTIAFQIQDNAGTALFTADTSGLVITIAGNTTNFANLTLTNSHFESTQTNPPTIGIATCASGGNQAVTAASTDSAGSFTTGNLTTGGNCVLTITFNKSYGAGAVAPKSVIITPKSSTAPAANAYVSSTSPTTFVVTFNTSVGTSITDSFYYWVIE